MAKLDIKKKKKSPGFTKDVEKNKVWKICFVHTQVTKLNKGNFYGKNIMASNA